MKSKEAQATLAILLLVVAVFAIDRMIPAHVSASALYVVPIMLTIITGSVRLLALTTLLTIILTLTGYFLTTGESLKHLWSDELVSLLVQVATALLVFRRMRDAERERAVQAEAEAERQKLALIHKVGQVFASTLDLQTIYVAIRERLSEIIDCDSMLVSLYDINTETIRCGFAYTDGGVMSTDAFEPIKLGSGPHSECIRNARPVIVDNIKRQHPSSFRYVGYTDNYPLSVIHVPMIAEDRVIGVIQAQSLRESSYSEADIPMLSIIASQAAIAIQNARLYEDAIRARHAMEQANKVKDEFLAMLSHELRTPLTPILGWTKILAKLSPEDRETRNHALEVIERNARLQTQLVNDLLDLSRIGAGKLSINLQPTDINWAVRAAIESIRAGAESRNIEIEARLAQSEVIVMADQSRLGQIINNLLMNAIKFTNDNGRVEVSTEITGGHCALIVKDSGLGIAPDFLPHVFDKFRQGDGSTRRRHSGLGLGLSIVKSLVELHGGEVTASSEGIGLGATFTVRLPLAAQKDVAAHHKTGQSEIAPLAAQISDTLPELRLLVIEDDADTLEMMRVLCDAQNIKVTGARTAEEGFQLLLGKKPDLIISDIKLPGMDGHELARRLRADAELDGVPLIAITGLATDADRSTALDAGFDAHLSKPINYGEMFELVRRLARPRVAPDN